MLNRYIIDEFIRKWGGKKKGVHGKEGEKDFIALQNLILHISIVFNKAVTKK